MFDSRAFQGKRALLIGGAGFIGHNLALELKKAGAEVHIIDSLQVNNFLFLSDSGSPSGNKAFYRQVVLERLNQLENSGVHLHTLDARDYHGLCKVLGKIRPNHVVHLAAVAHANRSNKDPHSTFDHSLRTLENGLDASRGKEELERYVYFSSSMVYGNFHGADATEETQCNPLGIYGALKFAGEKMVIAYNQVFDLPYTIIRPSALYGERCISRRVGQAFIENVLAGQPLEIDGDGSDRLDFTYIQDLVQGVMLSLCRPEAKGEIFNITYGASRSLKDLVGVLQPYFPNIEHRYKERDRLMPERGTLSVDKARRLLGYDPQWPIEKGFERYISWYKEFWARSNP